MCSQPTRCNGIIPLGLCSKTPSAMWPFQWNPFRCDDGDCHDHQLISPSAATATATSFATHHSSFTIHHSCPHSRHHHPHPHSHRHRYRHCHRPFLLSPGWGLQLWGIRLQAEYENQLVRTQVRTGQLWRHFGVDKNTPTKIYQNESKHGTATWSALEMITFLDLSGHSMMGQLAAFRAVP